MNTQIAQTAKLADLLTHAEAHGLIGCRLDGADVSGLILQETDSDTLVTALKHANAHQEILWARKCAQRLVEVAPVQDNHLAYARTLMTNGAFDAAEEQISHITAPPHSSIAIQLIRGGLLAYRGKTDETIALFEALEGRRAGHYMAPGVLPLVEILLEHAPLDFTSALIAQLHALYPDHLATRSLAAQCALIHGDTDRAHALLDVPDDMLSDAPGYARRLFRNTRADFFIHRGWSHEVFDLAKACIADDPEHWSMYSSAAETIFTTWRNDEYDALINSIPHGLRRTPPAMAVRCRWLIERNRLDEAEALLDQLRTSSAQLYLGARLYMAINHGNNQDVEAVFRACLDCGVAPLGPTLAYAMHAFYFANTPELIRDCLAQLEVFETESVSNQTFQQIYLHCLIADGQEDRAQRIYESLPAGLKSANRLAPFEMYFSARRGDHDTARAGWTRHLRQSRHFCINGRTSYPRTVSLKYDGKPDDVLLFANVFNGEVYVDWLLDHYRSLGVDHFFIIDNKSTDSTVSRLIDQPDVSLFANPDSFAAAGFGIVWTNHQMQRFGLGHWCLHVDWDEGFVFPGQERGRTLRDFLAYLDAHGYGCVSALAIDMYPEHLSASSDDNLFEQNCYFDTDYARTASEIPPYAIWQGGIRQRLTGQALSMQKVPLLKVGADTRYIECNHNSTHLPVADVTGAVLHYKFVGDAHKRFTENIERGQHFGGAVSYSKLTDAVGGGLWDTSLISEFSRRYTSPKDLEAAGLISSSPHWDAYVPPGGKQ